MFLLTKTSAPLPALSTTTCSAFRGSPRCPRVFQDQTVSAVTQGHRPHSASHVRELRAAFPPDPPTLSSPNCSFSGCLSRAEVHAERGEMSSRSAQLSAARHPKLPACVQSSPNSHRNSLFSCHFEDWYVLQIEKGNPQPSGTCWGHQDPNLGQTPKICGSYHFSSLGFSQVWIFFHLSNLLDHHLLISALNILKK